MSHSDPISTPNMTKEIIEPLSRPNTVSGVRKFSSPEEKIRLFRSLFRGREDVFAKRWYSLTKEKGGYSPVCGNEWKEGVCPKPKSSCSEKQGYKFNIALPFIRNIQSLRVVLSGTEASTSSASVLRKKALCALPTEILLCNLKKAFP